MSRLQIEAATMTPAANPVRERWTILDNSFLIKYTQAEPAAVPIKGMLIPRIKSVNIPLTSLSRILSIGAG